MSGMADRIHVLHVDDDPDLADTAATFLEREDERFTIDTATRASDGLDRLAEREFDCIISDYDMPGKNGIEFLEAVREEYPDIPFILYTGKGSEEIASDAISAGVTDYLQKGSGTSQYTVLANRINNAVEKYATQTQLIDREKRLNLFFEQSPLGVIEWDEQFQCVRINESAEDILGYTEADLAGHSWEKIVPASDRADVSDVVSNLLENKGGYHSINENVRKNGERIICEWHNRVVTNDDGDVIAIFSQFQDITEQKEQERKRQQIIDRVTNAIVEVDANWEFSLVNEQAEDLYDMDEEELLGRDFWEVFHEAQNTRFEAEYRQAMETRDPTSFVEYFSQLDGWFDISVYPNDDGGLAFYFVEVTEQRQRQQELEQTNTVLSTLFETLPLGVLAEDSDRNVLAINDRMFELFDFPVSPDEIDGVDCEQLAEHVSESVVDSERFVDRINDLVAAREPTDNEEIALKDGRTFERSYRPITLSDGVGHLWLYRDVTDRKSHKRELETVQRRFEAVLENTTTPMFMKDDEGAYVFVNRAYCDLFDRQTEEIVGRTDHDIHPPEMAADVQKNDQAVIERGEPVETEERIVVNGEERIFLSTKVPIYDTGERSDPDTPVAVFGVATDITDRQEAERQLREEQQFVQSIFQSLPDPLYAFDTEGQLIRWNETFEDVVGYSRTELEGMSVTEFVPEDETETIATNFRTILDEKRSVTVESAIETNDGTRIPYEFAGGPLEAADGTIRGVTGIGRDITERATREQQLKALNRTAQELMSADTTDEVVEIGIETTRDLLGMDANSIHLYDDDAEGLVPAAATDAVYDLVGEPPTFTGEGSIAWRVYQRGEPLAVDDVHEDPDRYNPDTAIQSELYLPLGEYGILIAGSPLLGTFDEQDVLMGEILAGGLTTALEQVERTEQLRARERELTEQNERLDEFASIVSHDLRNPLNVAQGRVKLAAEECDSEHLEQVERAHERMQTLIEDLLNIAREGEAGMDVESVALAPLVEGCWANVETDAATLVTETDTTVQADKSRLKQLFENLMRNAVEHGGGDVTVTVGALADGFYIEDDGPGIPADERESIFEAGYSTSADGIGFGLSIVKQIVDAHDWDIHVTDSEAGGARFEIIDVG